MGEVYLARRRAAGVEKWLVVKRMRPERAGDARFLDLFMREARLSMSLAHQNIVPVFDFGRIDDQVFLAMERVEGKDLGSSLATRRQAGCRRCSPRSSPPSAARRSTTRTSRKSPDGADARHRSPRCHAAQRAAVVVGRGQADRLRHRRARGRRAEQDGRHAGVHGARASARRSRPIARADVYAVGIVLREALTGERPRHGDDRETRRSPPRRPARSIPWPDGFDVAAARRSSIARPPSRQTIALPDARAMLEELDAFIVGERAAKKADAPARQLAAWLADVWEGERDDDRDRATSTRRRTTS